MRRSLLAVLPLLCVVAPGAAAQCNFLTLASGVPQSSGANPAYARFVPVIGGFAVVGTRSAAGSDHTCGVYNASAASPTCVSTLLAQSATPSGVDDWASRLLTQVGNAAEAAYTP